MLFLVFFTTPSFAALFEVRGHYEILLVEPERLNILLANVNAPKTTSLMGFGIDALISLPGVPIGFGARYETVSKNDSTSNSTDGRYDYETGFSRIAMLVNRRFLDEFVFLGPIAGIGISNSVFYSYRNDRESRSYRTVGGTSLSLGVEGGVKASSLVVGAEVGYLFANFKPPKVDGVKLETNDGEVNLDFSGPYAKILIGTTF